MWWHISQPISLQILLTFGVTAWFCWSLAMIHLTTQAFPEYSTWKNIIIEGLNLMCIPKNLIYSIYPPMLIFYVISIKYLHSCLFCTNFLILILTIDLQMLAFAGFELFPHYISSLFQLCYFTLYFNGWNCTMKW